MVAHGMCDHLGRQAEEVPIILHKHQRMIILGFTQTLFAAD
jgi:hypothetical protein